MQSTKSIQPEKSHSILNSNALKLIAILAMTADHLAWLPFPGYDKQPLPILMHIIGRLTCPIMCYFIAEGFHYTRSKARYRADLHCVQLYSSPFFSGGKKGLLSSSIMWCKNSLVIHSVG